MFDGRIISVLTKTETVSSLHDAFAHLFNNEQSPNYVTIHVVVNKLVRAGNKLIIIHARDVNEDAEINIAAFGDFGISPGQVYFIRGKPRKYQGDVQLSCTAFCSGVCSDIAGTQELLLHRSRNGIFPFIHRGPKSISVEFLPTSSAMSPARVRREFPSIVREAGEATLHVKVYGTSCYKNILHAEAIILGVKTADEDARILLMICEQSSPYIEMGQVYFVRGTPRRQHRDGRFVISVRSYCRDKECFDNHVVTHTIARFLSEFSRFVYYVDTRVTVHAVVVSLTISSDCVALTVSDFTNRNVDDEYLRIVVSRSCDFYNNACTLQAGDEIYGTGLMTRFDDVTIQMTATSIDVFESKTARCNNGTFSYNPAIDSSGDIDQGYGPRRELLSESLAVSADGGIDHVLEFSAGEDDPRDVDDGDDENWLVAHYGDDKVARMLAFMKKPRRNVLLVSLKGTVFGRIFSDLSHMATNKKDLMPLAEEAVIEIKHRKGDDVEFCVYLDEEYPDAGCHEVSEDDAKIREFSCSLRLFSCSLRL